MLGFPDSEKCPTDLHGERLKTDSLTVEEFLRAAETHFSEGGPLPSRPLRTEPDPREFFVPYSGRPYYVGVHPSRIKPPVTQDGSIRIPVNKATHRIRFENETESEVTVVIEPKERVSAKS